MLSRESRRVWRTCKRIWRRMPGRPRLKLVPYVYDYDGKSPAGGTYNFETDVIQMPLTHLRDTPAAFLQSFCHELIHSTGFNARLNRTKPHGFNYAMTLFLGFPKDLMNEEAIAELGSARLLIRLGLLPPRAASGILIYLSHCDYSFNSRDIEDRAEEAVSYVLNN